MQPARIKPHAEEHTNNPGQKPNFRGHAAGDVEVTRDCGKAPPPPKRTPRRPLGNTQKRPKKYVIATTTRRLHTYYT